MPAHRENGKLFTSLWRFRGNEQESVMPAFDPRITPARADLAAKHLEGKVTAARYVEGRLCEVIGPQAPLRLAPRPDAPLATEALKGERVTIYETNAEGWAWGQLGSARYVGWLPANALAPPGAPPTHKVAALRTFAFPAPSIKRPPLEALPLGARLAIARTQDAMAVTQSGAYVPAAHLKPIDADEPDFVAVAERFLGVPYLWGGKTALGLDCSGLVQIALAACGILCPRDSDMQEQALGMPIRAAADFSDLQRGDLVFWKGHVSIARDRRSLLHANAFHMAVVIEPIADAIGRIRSAGSEITGVRRITR
jgi:cell wall-associated NlpC family hydrolase